MMKNILFDTSVDALKMLPFLLFAYLTIEWLEHCASEKLTNKLRSAGKYGSFVGAMIGCVPQCGFSVAAVKFYNAGLISLGALISVFLSTSDEALPILISAPGSFHLIWKLLLCKVLIAAFVGFLIDFLLRKKLLFYKKNKIGFSSLSQQEPLKPCSCKSSILKPALRHTFQTLLFIAGISFLLNVIIVLIGEARLSAFLLTNSLWQPFLAGLIGFIPNCSASVILTQLYLSGSLSFGSALAGLCTSAGVGIAVLFKSRTAKDSFTICAILYISGVTFGILFHFIF